MPPARRYATYLFDLDGTLIDSTALIMASFRHVIRARRGAPPPPEDEARWRAGFGTPLRTQLARFGDTPEEIAAMVESYRAYTDAHHDRLLATFPGMHAALDTLRETGVRLAVVTSKTHALARRGLERCGLSDYFEVLVGVDDVERHKPHPAPVLAALARLQTGPDRAVFVGDSPHDVRAGHAAGVRTAAVLWGPFARAALTREAPDHWVAEPADIARLGP